MSDNQITEITDTQIARENAAFDMLQRQAKMFSTSSLVPKDFQGNLANCAIGINIAKRLGADPFMVLQNIDIIHGRPSFRATFLIAMVNASGRFEPLQFDMQGTEGKPDRACIAWAKSKSDGSKLEGPKITLEMAKSEGWSTKSGSKWLTMPELMLRYRAAAFFARLYAPDITLGMMTVEEATDIVERDITPMKEPLNPFARTEEPTPMIEVEPVTPQQPEPVTPTEEPPDDATVDLLAVIADADATQLTHCVGEVGFLTGEKNQTLAKDAIKKRAKVLGVKFDKEKGEFVV